MSWEAYSFLGGGGDTGTKGGKPHLGCNICKKNKIIRKDFNVEIKLKGLPSSLLIINLNGTILKTFLYFCHLWDIYYHITGIFIREPCDKVFEDKISQYTIPRLPPSIWAHRGTQHTKHLLTGLSPRRGSRASGGDWWMSLSLRNKTWSLKYGWQFQENLHYAHHTTLRTLQRWSVWRRDTRLTGKPVTLLHTSNEWGTVTIATSKRTINLAKYGQGLYKENYKPFQRTKITNTQRNSTLTERKAQDDQHIGFSGSDSQKTRTESSRVSPG